MFDPAHTSDEIDLTDEDCRASLIESEAIGTSFAIPACFDSIRYFELTIETNRGGIFVGWATEDVYKKFPSSHRLLSGLGSVPGTWAFDSYTGSVGTAGKWQPYAKRKLRPGDVVGCLLDTKRGQLCFFLDKGKFLGDCFPSNPFTSSSTSVFYAACTLKYKGTTVVSRFSPPFVHQKSVDAYIASHYLGNTGLRCLPVSETHPALARAEAEVALQHLRSNQELCIFYQMPEETLLNIFFLLTAEELAGAMRVCRLFRCIATENTLWSSHLNRSYGKSTNSQSFDASAARASRAKSTTGALKSYNPTDSSLYARFRVLHNWNNGKLNSKRNFWCNTDVKCVQFDNRYIACGTEEEIILFDAETGAKMEPALQLLEEVLCIDFDQSKIVACGSGGSCYIYDVETSQLSTRFSAHKKDIEAMHLVRDTSALITGSWNKDIKFWDLDTESMVLRIENAHTGAISGLRWLDPQSPNVFASISYDSIVKFWDTRVGPQAIHSIAKLHIGAISAIAIARDQTQFVTGGEDGTLKLVELRQLSDAQKGNTTGLSEDGMFLQQYRGHTQTIRGIHFEKGGRLVSASADCSVRMWDQRTSKMSCLIPTGKVTSMACDDDVLVVGLEGKRATMLDFRMFKSQNTEARRKFFCTRRQTDILD